MFSFCFFATGGSAVRGRGCVVVVVVSLPLRGFNLDMELDFASFRPLSGVVRFWRFSSGVFTFVKCSGRRAPVNSRRVFRSALRVTSAVF